MPNKISRLRLQRIVNDIEYGETERTFSELCVEVADTGWGIETP